MNLVKSFFSGGREGALINFLTLGLTFVAMIWLLLGVCVIVWGLGVFGDLISFRDPLIELDNEIDVDGHKTSASSWMAKMEQLLIVFSVFATLIIQWVGISFQVMVESIKETYNKPPPPPEEIGITGTF